METPVSKWAETFRKKVESGEWVELTPGVFGAAKTETVKKPTHQVSRPPILSKPLETRVVPKHIKDRYKRFGLKYTPPPVFSKSGHAAPAAPVKEQKPKNTLDPVDRGTNLWDKFHNMVEKGADVDPVKFADSMTRLHNKVTAIEKKRHVIQRTDKRAPKETVKKYRRY
jgi:hypothetical protein